MHGFPLAVYDTLLPVYGIKDSHQCCTSVMVLTADTSIVQCSVMQGVLTGIDHQIDRIDTILPLKPVKHAVLSAQDTCWQPCTSVWVTLSSVHDFLRVI